MKGLEVLSLDSGAATERMVAELKELATLKTVLVNGKGISMPARTAGRKY